MKKVSFLLLMFIAVDVSGQDISMPGQVLDSKKNPITGAQVNIVGENPFAVTDANGIFSLVIPNKIKKGSLLTLRVSKGGYITSSRLVPVSQIITLITLINSKNKNKNKAVVNDQPVNRGITTNIKGNEQHLVTGNGNAVGINGNVFYGVKQRHLNDSVLTYILTYLPDKEAEVVFLWGGGKEGENYAKEIYDELIKRGYSKLKPSHWMDPDGYDKVYVTKQNDELQLRICPISDVQ